MKIIKGTKNSVLDFDKFIQQFDLSTDEVNKILKYFKNLVCTSGFPSFAWPLPDKYEIIKHINEIKNYENNDNMDYKDRYDSHLFDYIDDLEYSNEIGEQEIEYIDKYRNSNALLQDNFEWYVRTNGVENSIDNFHIIYKGLEEFDMEDNKYIFIIGYSSIPFIVHEFSQEDLNISKNDNILSHLYFNSSENKNILNKDKKYSFSQFLNYIFENSNDPKETYPNFVEWIKNNGIKF